MDPTDIRYILDDLACNASQEALQELYMLYYKRIARYIGLYVRYDGAVMELTSDVFFAVWENRLELPEIRNFNAYIYRIAKFTFFCGHFSVHSPQPVQTSSLTKRALRRIFTWKLPTKPPTDSTSE